MNRLIVLFLLLFLGFPFSGAWTQVLSPLVKEAAYQVVQSTPRQMIPMVIPSFVNAGRTSLTRGVTDAALQQELDKKTKSFLIKTPARNRELEARINREELLITRTGKLPALESSQNAWRNLQLRLNRYAAIAQLERVAATQELSNLMSLSSTYQVNYAELIDPDARLILLGETHNQPLILDQIQALLKQYRAAYPTRRIYLLTEFASYHSPELRGKGQVKSMLLDAVRIERYRALFVLSMLRLDIKMGGLEHRSVLHSTLRGKDEAAWVAKYSNVAAVEQRNAFWTQAINQYRQNDPEGIYFVYCGADHALYNNPSSVSIRLKDSMPFVINFVVGNSRLKLPSSFYYWNLLDLSAYVQPGIIFQGVALTPQAAHLFGADLTLEIHPHAGPPTGY